MTYHAMFSLYIMTGLLALIISVSLFCKSVAEAKGCTETGVVYESIKDAAERTKTSPNCIGSAVSGMAGGYHWEYADD